MINESRKEELLPRLIEYVSQITTPSRKAGKNMFVCPLCGSGAHGGRNSDGAFHVTGQLWYCHSCHRGGDIFTLYAKINGLDTVSDFPKINNGLIQTLGVPQIDSARRDFTPERKEAKKEVKVNPERTKQIEGFAGQMTGSPAEKYLHERGFSDETISHFMLGYDAQMNRVVIPYPGNDFTTKRALDPGADRKYLYPSGESIPLFMIKDGESDFFFITEGQLDAISIYQAGAKNVIAIGGGSYHLIEELLETQKIAGAVIVADRDPEEKREKKTVSLQANGQLKTSKRRSQSGRSSRSLYIHRKDSKTRMIFSKLTRRS